MEAPPSEHAGTRLLDGQYLANNEYIVSRNGAFFAIMQGDGNFCVYAGTGPGDNRGLIWMSGEYGSAADYVALIQPDGNFVTSHGTVEHRGGNYWSANVVRTGNEFQLLLQDDGQLVLAATHGTPEPEDVMWRSDQRASPGNGYVRDVHADSTDTQAADGPCWHAFVPGISGALIALDVWMGVSHPRESVKFTLRLYAGAGVDGTPLGQMSVWTDRKMFFDSSRFMAEFEYPIIGGGPAPPLHLDAGKTYTLAVDGNPTLAYGVARGDYDPFPFAFRTYMRPARPKWSHPVG